MPKTENPADIVESVGYWQRVLFEELTEILDPEPHGAALNMAIDEALLATATMPTLRIYGWSRAAVSFGYFGRSAEVAAQWPSREAVRRWTGGGIVLHGDDITDSLFVPKTHAVAARGPADCDIAIHACVAEWMRGSGLDVNLTAGGPKQSEECFANPAPGDVLAGTQKISGAAQRRTRIGMLHQGSIQPAPVALRARRALLAEAFSARVIQRPLRAEELAAADALVESKYGTAEWLQRW